METRYKTILIEAVCLLYILLFIYAGVSKILDFENFQVQLSQSPLLSAFSLEVSWSVPIIELIISLLLILPKYRFVGLFSAFTLMTIFTAYIFIMLNFSPFIPCSCGGILGKMSWKLHLFFNLFFVVLAGYVLTIIRVARINNKRFFIQRIIIVNIICSISIVVILFVLSEKIMHQENPFLRRYPPHPAEFSNAVELKFNSYYIAGFSGNRLYLGNYTTPLQITSFDYNLKDQKLHKIKFDPREIPFKVVSWYVKDDYFYLLDGSVHRIFKGKIKNWKIEAELADSPFFTKAIPIDSTRILFRTNRGERLTNVVGIFTSENEPKVQYFDNLLEIQGDGIFGTDGTLMYSTDQKKIVYVYYYRNGFVVSDINGSAIFRGNTIDTVKHANIKVSTLKKGTEFAISSPALAVNPSAAVYRNLLFVRSAVKGKLENHQLWEKSFVLDVYDFKKNLYLFSFPIYHTSSNKSFSSLLVTKEHIYALLGSDLVVYEIKNDLKKEMNSK